MKVLLLNNLGDGMVRQWQDLFFANRYSGTDKTLHKKDFVKAVEADGFGFARRVGRCRTVRPALEEFVALRRPGVPRGAWSTRPRTSIRWSRPGMGYKDMITGQWIPSRARRRSGSGEVDPTRHVLSAGRAAIYLLRHAETTC